ncbi:MAG: DUF4040 domain-containing protein [Nitriliruptor sp.]|nr:MAG: DUF4040 domain-containing protein [Nitriliruptor sp.]
MIEALDVVLFLVLIVAAVLALVAKDLLTAVAMLTAYSLFVSLLFAGVSAVDVSLVEAALGAGITGLLLIAAVLATTRHSEPRPDPRRRYVVLPLVGLFLATMLYAATGLPDRGDPEAPAQLGVSQVYLSQSLEDTETPNVVTSLLADYRSQDTLGETLVILTAALSAAMVLVRRPDQDDHAAGHDGHGADADAGDDPGHDDHDAGADADADRTSTEGGEAR